MDAITAAAKKHKQDAATLRKESSKRDPVRRPELLKMRRESLSQILMNNSKHKMALRERKGNILSPRRLPFSSPRKKKRGEAEVEESPSKIRRKEEEETRKSERIAAKENKMAPPAAADSAVKRRTKKVI